MSQLLSGGAGLLGYYLPFLAVDALAQKGWFVIFTSGFPPVLLNNESRGALIHLYFIALAYPI